MKIGVFYFPVDYGINIAELARALEERGFESLFVPEHTHIPVSRRTPFPSGGELPKRYAHTHDPFVALSFAAAVTKNLRLGTGICLIPERDPIVTAKEVASLDQLSGGRFEFGIGGGWNVEEMENHGARYNTRFKLMRERILAMKALWTQEEAEYHGEMVDFDKVWSYPKPAQKPHPPILLGGETDYTLRRVVEYCDGWFPRPGRGVEIREQLARLNRMAAEKGRDPKTISTSVFRAPTDKAALEGIRGGRHRPRRARNPRREPRRDPARPRPLRAAAEIGDAPRGRLVQMVGGSTAGCAGLDRNTRSAARPTSCVIAASTPPATTPPTTGTSFPTFAACPAPASAVADTPATRSAFLSSAGDIQAATSRVIRTPRRTPAFFSVSAAFDPVRQASTRPRTSGVRISCPRRWAIAAIIRT